nr:hypothetical protein [Lentzea indica]
MNNPTIDSTPAKSAGRPETVRPNTTSCSPDDADNTLAHAACTTVDNVTRSRRASSTNLAVTPSLSCVRRRSWS